MNVIDSVPDLRAAYGGLSANMTAHAGHIYRYGHIGDTPIAFARAITNSGVVAFARNGAVICAGHGGFTTIGQGMGAVFGVWIDGRLLQQSFPLRGKTPYAAQAAALQSSVPTSAPSP